MPSIDQTVTELPTMTSSIEVFHSFKSRDDSKESDDESLHLQLEEDDNEEKIDEGPSENEDEILHKFDPEYKQCNGDAEETSDNKETHEESEKQETEKDSEQDKEQDVNGEEDKHLANEEVKEIQDNSTETVKNSTEEASTENVTEDDDNNKEETSVGNSEEPPPVTVEETGTSNSSVEKIDDKEQEKVDEVVNAEDKDDKCENDTEEDLLDISKVRDVEEDNADNASNEECDEDTSDKMENDEIPNEQTNIKNDEVDIEETNLEMNCNEEDKSKELIEETDNDKNNESTVNLSHDVEMTDDVNSETRNSSKRSLDSNDNISNSDGSNVIKRQRLEENLQTVQNKLSDNNNKESQIPIVLQSIDSFKDFMKKKNYKISVYDLEELCLEKTCEVIQYCSKLGDARHQIQLQKQLVESLRKELQQVMKQTRDLEIVNRKLMGDVKQCMAALSAASATTKTTTGEQTEGVTTTTAPPKPLQPLKITRSVGLQVRFTTPFETATIATKRRQPVILPHQKIPIVSITNNKNAKSVNSATPIRQQAVIQKTATTNQSAPILTQALTSSRKSDTNNKLPVQGARPRVATATAAPSSSSTTTTSKTTPSIIDLTDEDERQNRRVSTITTAAATTTTTGQNRNTVARNPLPLRQNNQIQSVRTVASNVRLTASSSSTSPSSTISTTKQINTANGTITTTQTPMYLLQSIPQTMLTSSLTTAAKVVLSLQTPNGLLNGSTVTIQRPTAPSIQLKPVHTLKAPSLVTTTTNTTTINGVSSSSNGPNNRRSPNQHPAPLPLPPPPPPNKLHLKPIPPKPHLTIRKTDSGIILQWKMPYELDMYEIIASYQLFAYQETNATPDTDMWRRVGDVKALALPMACTLTQFADNNKYYFAVRPVDIHKRIGAFSDPEEISL